MKVNQAFRFELKPNQEQKKRLAQHAGTARFAYNWGLAERIKLWEQEQRGTNAIAQHKQLNALKITQFPWMYEVSKCAPQEALRDLDRAFRHFFAGLKAGQKAGFPRFKKKGFQDSFRLTGSIHVLSQAIQLPRLGSLRLKESTEQFEGKILSATVRREADRWFVALAVEAERPDPDLAQGAVVGVDLGLTIFAALSTGEKITAPKPLHTFLKRLRRRSQQHSHKLKGSANRQKSALRLAKLHARIRHIRQDFLHQTTTHLAKTKPVIVLEDLHVKGLIKNPRLSRSIADVGWSELRRMLDYKTQWYGSQLVVAPRFLASSKTCSQCGQLLAGLPLSARAWICPACGLEHDRDVNAAQNLVNWYLSTVSSTGINACGDSSGGGTENLSPVYESRVVEAGNDLWNSCP